ncbi:MAG TPA: hypothetical protein VII51_03820 [Gaiellaceae bacterium]
MERWEEGFDTWMPAARAAPPHDPRAELEGLKRTLRAAAERVAELQRRLEAELLALAAREESVEARERVLGTTPSLSEDLTELARAHAQTRTQT